jgi:hypothetical protein
LNCLSLSHASPVAAVLTNVLANPSRGKEMSFEAAFWNHPGWAEVFGD